jgi:pumilio family protein 6
MAGIKRKSTGAGAPDVKAKSKKVKVDKPTTKRETKHDVKPVKKAKKAKEESSDDFEESDTSEKDNGFYGFSAADGADVDMSDAESSDETEQQTAKSNGKTQKPTDDGAESKLAGLNCKLW